jgi:mono/diheme cytochrome c family protein
MFKVITTVLVLGTALYALDVKKGNIQPTPANGGKAMFGEYCAVCHGVSGRGNGPAVDALKKRPADLTQLTRKNNGNYPEVHVMNFITGEEAIAAHGNRDMPMWGQLFHSLEPNNAAVTKVRVRVLADYIKTLQDQ